MKKEALLLFVENEQCLSQSTVVEKEDKVGVGEMIDLECAQVGTCCY